MRFIEVLHQRLMAERYQHRLPYKEVLKSISTDGTQYWDTGISPTPNTKAQVDYTTSDVSSVKSIFGSRTGSTSGAFSIFSSYTGGKARFDYASQSSIISTTTITADTRTSLVKDGIDNYVNGVKQTSNNAETFTNNRPMYLGVLNNNGSPLESYYFVGKIHLCKIWQNGTVMSRDMIPVLDWNDQPCFYDRVAKELLYANTQTGLTYERWNMLEVDYLQGNGNQYINTGIVPSGKKISMILDFQLTQIASNDQISGSMVSDGGDNFQWAQYDNPTKWRWELGTMSGYGDVCDTNRHTVYFNTSEGIRLDDTVIISTQYTIPSTNIYSIYLFSRHQVQGNIPCKMKCYSAKYYDDTELVRDYIPCVINGTGYMYDRAENKLYANAGTGSFSAGIVIDGVDYKIGSSIESSGSQYIDTGISSNANSGIKVKFAYTALANESSPISASSGSQHNVVQYYNGNLSTYMGQTLATYNKSGIVVNTDYEYEVNTGLPDVQKCYVDGVELTTSSSIRVFSNNGQNWWLFARNNGGSAGVKGSMKMYYCQLSDNGELIQNLIPCQYTDANNNTVTTMLDLVSKAPLTPSGTFTFNALGS